MLKNYFFVGLLKVNDENSRIWIQAPDPDPGSRSGSEFGSGSISQRHGSADPDPIRICTKMSWIRNTGSLQRSPILSLNKPCTKVYSPSDGEKKTQGSNPKLQGSPALVTHPRDGENNSGIENPLTAAPHVQCPLYTRLLAFRTEKQRWDRAP